MPSPAVIDPNTGQVLFPEGQFDSSGDGPNDTPSGTPTAGPTSSPSMPFSTMGPNASPGTIDVNSMGSINNAANYAIQSSSPYTYGQTNLISGSPDTEGNPNSAKNQSASLYQQEAYSPQNWATQHPEQAYGYSPILSSAGQTLGGPNSLADVNPGIATSNAGSYSAANANATQAPVPQATAPGTYDADLATAAQGRVAPGSQYNATNAAIVQGQVAPGSQYTAAQSDNVIGSVDLNSMVDQQFARIMGDGSTIPDWAKTAVTQANQRMNALGLGASTMAGGATTAAMLNAAMPIAMANAQVVAQVNAQNIADVQQTMLTNTAAKNAAFAYNASVVADLNKQNIANAQQTILTNAAANNSASQYNASVAAQLNLQNLLNKQQVVLSNQAATNAARQFNAQSTQQNNQFFSGLTAQVTSQNADRSTAVSQFNAAQDNTAGQFNAQSQQQNNQYNASQSNAMAQFVDNLNSQRQEFNSQNQLLVDQSNVQWQRAINTANTAGINSANQANVQNLFNLSQTAQNNLWQQARDEASWALTAQENSQNRLLSLVNSSLNRQTSLQILSSQMNANMFNSLGGLASNLLGGSLGGSLSRGIGDLFSGSSTGNDGTSGNLGGGIDFGGGGGFPDVFGVAQ